MIALGTIISDRYKILEKVGEGGMSIVYRAEDITLKRDVTLKTLKGEFVADDDFKKRFSIEARAAAGLSHPNIVTVFDVGNDGDVYYIVMEYVDGFTLKELINERAPFENKEAVGIAIHIAAALDAAHSHGVVHRDIKPHNILIARDGAIKVTDFGIARATSSTTVVSDGLGSVHYFSPEQARGGYVDAKTDIYSLGIVLFEMATGKLPFEGENAVQLAMKHINDPLPDMYEINPKITKSIEYIIKKATAKNTVSRYATVKEMCDDLKRAMNNDTGDFVKFNIEVASSDTIKITDEQLQEINKLAAESEKDKHIDFVYGDNPEFDWKSFADKNNGETAANNETAYSVNEENANNNEGFTILTDEDEVYSGYGNEEDQNEKKKEKKVVTAAVITGIIICILIAFVVYIFVARNVKIERQVVPNLTGSSIENAISIANTKALYVVKADTTSLEADEYDENVVYRQVPAAGSEAKTGDTITVYVGTKQREEVIVPIFIKSYLSAAQAEAERLGLKIELGKGDYETESQYSKDFIYKQEPSYGETVYEGSVVTVYVGTNEEIEDESKDEETNNGDKEKVEMIKVVGKTKEQAKAMIEDLGLYVNIVETHNSTYDKGMIVKQSTEEGVSINKGKTITLVASLGPEPEKETPAPVEQKRIIDVSGDNTPETSEKVSKEENNAAAVIDENNDNNSNGDGSASGDSNVPVVPDASNTNVINAGGEVSDDSPIIGE